MNDATRMPVFCSFSAVFSTHAGGTHRGVESVLQTLSDVRLPESLRQHVGDKSVLNMAGKLRCLGNNGFIVRVGLHISTGLTGSEPRRRDHLVASAELEHFLAARKRLDHTVARNGHRPGDYGELHCVRETRASGESSGKAGVEGIARAGCIDGLHGYGREVST